MMQSVCLVDLNFQDGAVAEYLDLTPAFQLSELSKVRSAAWTVRCSTSC